MGGGPKGLRTGTDSKLQKSQVLDIIGYHAPVSHIVSSEIVPVARKI